MLKKATVWADAGHVVAADQFALNTPAKESDSTTHTGSPLRAYEDNRESLYVSGDGFSVSFNKANGRMQSLRYNNNEMIHGQNGFYLNTYRSIDNDPREFVEPVNSLKDFNWTRNDNNTVTVTTVIETIVGKDTIPHQVVYTINPDGIIDVDAAFTVNDNFSQPRLSLESFLAPELEKVEWFGHGPFENAPDRKNAAFVGKYTNNVSDMGEPYVRAQSMGQRCDARYIKITDQKGNKGILITPTSPVHFSTLHHTDADLRKVKYGHDLPGVKRAETVLNLDCQYRGLGNASCGPRPRPQYEIPTDTTHTYSFSISPVK